MSAPRRMPSDPPAIEVDEILGWDASEESWFPVVRTAIGSSVPWSWIRVDSIGPVRADHAWWMPMPVDPTSDESLVPSVSIVAANGHILAVKATEDEAEDAVADLLSETGFEILEDDIDIEV